MLNYVGTNAVITYNFEFCQMTRWVGEDNLKGYIRFDNSHYLTNISDTNLIGDGYVNLSDGIIYWRKSKYQEYYSYEDNTVFIKDYNNQKSFARITYYDEDALVANLYKFYANIESGEDPGGGGGGGDTPSTSVTDPSLVSIEHTELRCREKQQVRPSDHSQDWTDTDVVRDKEECDVQVDSCECGREYQWVSVGTICDGVNKCDKLKYQYKDECNDSWNDYSPLIYKIGDVIEYDSSECGTVEYKEEWSEPFCGSYINDNYGLSLSSVNKYKIKIPYIKRKDEFVWSELNCNTLLEYELFYTNSFECGYKTTRKTYTYDEDLCGSEVKVKYPSLTNISDNNRYKITITHNEETAPYPTNTDDMTQDEWVWVETSTTYSYGTSTINDCECGYRSTIYKISEPIEYSCGYILNENESSTSPEYIVLTQNTNRSIPMQTFRIDATDPQTSGYYFITFSQSPNYTGSNASITTFSICPDEGTIYDNGAKKYITAQTNINDNIYEYTFSVPIYFAGAEQYAPVSQVTGYTNGSSYEYNDTANYEKWYEWVYCPSTDTLYNKTGKFEWRINALNTCECGYREYEWRVSNPAEYICGSELNEDTTFEIISTNGNWIREGNTFTSNDINDSETTIQRIYFKTNSGGIKFTIDQSSEKSYDYLIIGNLDKVVTNSTNIGSSYNYYNHKGKTTGTTSMTINDTSEHFVELMYRKDSSGSNNRDNVIVSIEGDMTYKDTTKYIKYYKWEYCPTDNTLDVKTNEIKWEVFENNSYSCGYKQYRWYDTGEDVCCGVLENSENNCTNYYKYNVEIYQVTEDGTNWNNVVPERYRYGSIVETNSPDCGYIPKLVQWKLICPDITYETAVSGDSCTVCETYLNAPTMYAIEKQQSSTDGGITWTDDYSNGKLITRTEKILKWKADKCGYTGDTFAWFIDKDSRTCDGTNQVGTYYFKVSSDGGNTWTNVEGIEPEVRIIDKTNDDYLSELDCSNTNQT